MSPESPLSSRVGAGTRRGGWREGLHPLVTKLWDKGYELDPRVERFEISDDLVYDQRLVVADALGSIGHAAGLAKAGLLPVETFHALRKELAHIVELAEAGEFDLTLHDEDVHTKIEGWLTEKLGEAGKQIHTGRSRNDQVVVDIRLFTREAVLNVYTAVLDAAESLLDLATRHAQTPMPGYTHMQRAMLSSVGVWAGALPRIAAGRPDAAGRRRRAHGPVAARVGCLVWRRPAAGAPVRLRHPRLREGAEQRPLRPARDAASSSRPSSRLASR